MWTRVHLSHSFLCWGVFRLVTIPRLRHLAGPGGRRLPFIRPSFLPPSVLPPVPAESRLLLSDLVPASLGEGRSLAVRVGAASVLLHLLFAPPGFHADPTC